jgi:hypothetical protein
MRVSSKSKRLINRHNLFLFRDTLLAMVVEDALPYKELVATEG